MKDIKCPPWGRLQKIKFVVFYALSKLVVFFEVYEKRFDFFVFEWKYSLQNLLNRIIKTKMVVWNKSEKIVTKWGVFNVRKNTQDAALISPAFEKLDFVFLVNLLEENRNKKIAFVDVGANIGKFAVSVGVKFKTVVTYAFEPGEENYQILKKNLRDNHVESVNTFAVALGDAHADLALFGHDKRQGDNSLYAEPGYQKIGHVKVVKMDDYAELKQFDVLVIKIDVEGHEVPVIKGAMEVLKSVPTVFLLIEDMMNRESLYRALNEAGALPLVKLTPYNSWWKIQSPARWPT